MKKIGLLFFFLSQFILAQGYGASLEIKSDWNGWKAKSFIVDMETGIAYKPGEVSSRPAEYEKTCRRKTRTTARRNMSLLLFKNN